MKAGIFFIIFLMFSLEGLSPQNNNSIVGLETTSSMTANSNNNSNSISSNKDKVCNQLMQNVRALRMLLTQFLTRYPDTDKFDSLIESAQDILSNTENICRIMQEEL